MTDAENIKVLIIDDDPFFVEFCGTYLARKYEVHVAFSAEEGVQKLNAVQPSAVILDLRMPRVSGLHILRYMHVWPKMCDIPVIVVTASRLTPLARKTLKERVNVCKCYSKSVRLETIEAAVKREALLGRLYQRTPALLEKVRTAEAVSRGRDHS